MENQTPTPDERRQPPPVYAPPYEKPPRNPFEKTPFLAGVLSVVPGLGNIYNGLYLRGLAFALICFGLFLFAVVNDAPFLIPFILFFWLFNIIDAYRQALRINYGPPTEELDLTWRPDWQSSGGAILGWSVFVIGLLGFADFVIDKLDLAFDLVDLLSDYWWLPFLGFGVWLVYKTRQERRERDAESEPSAISESSSEGEEDSGSGKT